jgi:hypothetical protein
MPSPPLRSSPERIRVLVDNCGVLNRVPEDDERSPRDEEIDWEEEEELALEQQGFYKGQSTLVLLRSVVTFP